MPEFFRFNSADLPQTEAFEAYRDLYALGSDTTRSGGAFIANVTAWRLDRIVLFERHLSGVTHSRKGRAGVDGFDHYVVTLLRSGRLAGEANGPFEVKPGQILLMDTRLPATGWHDDARLITVSVARDVVEAAFGTVGPLHGHVLEPPRNAFLADFMVTMVARAPGLAPEAFAPVCRAFLDILSTAATTAAIRGAELRRLDVARRLVVDRFIADSVADRALSVGSISQATGVSRSSLYRMFARQGGVARHIQQVRLDGVRRALDEGDPRTLALMAETYGFADESHMSRQFADAHGATPGSYRQTLSRTALDDPIRSRQRWSGWMGELS